MAAMNGTLWGLNPSYLGWLLALVILALIDAWKRK